MARTRKSHEARRIKSHVARYASTFPLVGNPWVLSMALNVHLVAGKVAEHREHREEKSTKVTDVGVVLLPSSFAIMITVQHWSCDMNLEYQVYNNRRCCNKVEYMAVVLLVAVAATVVSSITMTTLQPPYRVELSFILSSVAPHASFSRLTINSTKEEYIGAHTKYEEHRYQ